MAGTKIRGITIELGADTSGLQKALKGVNSQIGQTQKELKDVERLLKLDPKNTELLEQKQRLLGDRIGQTKDKLNALREAQKQVGEELQKTGKGQEQYDALTREIASCNVELQNLEKQASKGYQALQKIGQAGEKIKGVGDNIEKAGKSLRYVSAAAAGLLTGIVKTTADFDASMSKVAAISGAAGEDFDALRNKAREMGASTKFTATEAAEAMNYMAMAGWKTEQMLEGVPGIMHLAAASGEELATTSDIVTDALTAFGLQAEDSAHFADILASAAANANTNVGMMGESFKYAAPTAGALGYSAEDVALALGLMANSGIKASLAGTSLRNMFNRMAKPTKESQEAMERLGISLQDDEGNMYSFREIMDRLRKSFVKINIPLSEYNNRLDALDEALENGEIKEKAYTKAVEELNKQAFNAEGAEKARAAAMLGGTRAMSGLLAITNATEEDYRKLADAIDNSSQAFARTKDGVIPLNEALASGAEILETYSGSAEAMAATMQDNTAGKMEILKSKLSDLAISLGDTLTPALSDLIEKAQELVDKFNSLDDTTKSNIVNALVFTSVLSPMLTVVGNVTGAVGTLAKSFGALGTTVGVSGGYIALIIAYIVALGAAIATATKYPIEWANTWGQMWKKIEQFFVNGEAWVTEHLSGTGEAIRATLVSIRTWLQASIYAMEGLIKAVSSAIRGDVEGMFDGMKQAGLGFVDAMVSYFGLFVNSIIGGLNLIIAKVDELMSIDLGRIPLFKGLDLAGKFKSQSTFKGGMATGGTIGSGSSAIVGEAGAEILTVANGSATVTPLTGAGGDTNVIGLLETYLPYLAAGNTIVMDSGALVGSIAPDMNAALGTIAIRGGHR